MMQYCSNPHRGRPRIMSDSSDGNLATAIMKGEIVVRREALK